MNQPLVSLQNMYFKYPRTDNWILENASLDIMTGDKIGVVGDNGSGKSTITKLILGIISPIKGMVNYRGNPVKWSKHYSGIGYIGDPGHSSELQGLPSGITVKELIELLNQLYEGSVGVKRLQHLSELLNVKDILDKETQNLSTGERKRMMTLLALSKPNELLILDEPFDGLDEKVKDNLFKLLQEYLKPSLSLLYIAHNRMEIDLFTDKVFRLRKGNLEREKQTKFKVSSCIDNEQGWDSTEKIGCIQYNLIKLLEDDKSGNNIKIEIDRIPENI